jgi:hypothetical protein
LEINDKDLKRVLEDIPEWKQLLALVLDINKFLEQFCVYRTYKPRKSFWNPEGKGIETEKKWPCLDLAYKSTTASRADALPAEIKIETDLEKCKKSIEEMTVKYLIWKKSYIEKKDKELENEK